jgi:hypothetical protein
MLVATHPFGPFDLLRVPYVVAGDALVTDKTGRLRSAHDPHGPSLWWPRDARGDFAGVFEVAGCRLAGLVSTGAPPVVPDAGSWQVSSTLTEPGGHDVAAVWTSGRGDVWLPFDPGAVMQCLWSESYRRLRAGDRAREELRRQAVRSYYAVRPAMPRPVQLALRRRLARSAAGEAFPSWPLHTGLHDMYDWLLALLEGIAGEPLPWIAPWPDGHDWAFVLTHDVETARGVADIERLRRPERERGLRSSWNFVPERYDTPGDVIGALVAEDCEIGVHGLRHDGRDLASARVLRARLPAIRRAAQEWGARGFRSPATQRSWKLMPRLGFDYDTSYTDTDPYEPQPGGCCSYLPFFNNDLVELPITLPQDHTLFSILGHRDGSLWLDKARELRRRGGLVLVLSHPDYATGAAAAAWQALLEEFRSDPTMWQPVAHEAATWWRARAASRLVRDADGWRVVGPAAERARVRTGIVQHASRPTTEAS